MQVCCHGQPCICWRSDFTVLQCVILSCGCVRYLVAWEAIWRTAMCDSGCACGSQPMDTNVPGKKPEPNICRRAEKAGAHLRCVSGSPRRRVCSLKRRHGLHAAASQSFGFVMSVVCSPASARVLQCSSSVPPQLGITKSVAKLHGFIVEFEAEVLPVCVCLGM